MIKQNGFLNNKQQTKDIDLKLINNFIKVIFNLFIYIIFIN